MDFFGKLFDTMQDPVLFESFLDRAARTGEPPPMKEVQNWLPIPQTTRTPEQVIADATPAGALMPRKKEGPEKANLSLLSAKPPAPPPQPRYAPASAPRGASGKTVQPRLRSERLSRSGSPTPVDSLVKLIFGGM